MISAAYPTDLNSTVFSLYLPTKITATESSTWQKLSTAINNKGLRTGLKKRGVEACGGTTSMTCYRLVRLCGPETIGQCGCSIIYGV